jgi:hypothetical protein
MLTTLFGQEQRKYPGISKPADPEEVSIRLPDDVMPVMGCWFWQEEQLEPGGYKNFLDLASIHSPYNLLTTSFRLPEKEISERDFHDQIRLAAQYAVQKGIPLVVDLDVRLARRAFEAKYPDELQEMLILNELELSKKEPVETVIYSQDLNDHYTFRTTHYIPLSGSLLRIYSYNKTQDGIDLVSLKDITKECSQVICSRDSVSLRLPPKKGNRGSHACVMVSFTHLAPDVFAPHLISFQRELIQLYADAPLAGVCKDEWGFPPCYDGNPEKNQFWYSKHRAQSYAERTGGRELLFDCLMMHLGIKGKETERQVAINHFMEMSWQRNGELETDFYHAVKDVFGPLAVVATHPTWWPYPDLNEYKKNGLDWWVSKRDWAQTDEHTPFPVRTALAKKWGSPIWYNMYYADNKRDYETSLWSHALAGGRVNYHRIYPSPENDLGQNERLELLRGDLMRAESRIRLLNYISKSSLECPVAIIFGHACTMNWAGPAYDDVGMDLANGLWSAGIPADLIPSSEIENGSLKIDENGWVTYGEQRYAALVLYHPEFSRESVSGFFQSASTGNTALFRIGEWTQDFNGNPLSGDQVLPESMFNYDDFSSILEEIQQILFKNNIHSQTPATGSLEYSTHTMSAPPTTGFCRLNDGTLIQLAGTENVKGDPIQSKVEIQNQMVSFDATGVAAVRLNSNGQVEALAAGSFKSFKSEKMEILLDEPVDLAFWINENGEYEGVIQGWERDIPPRLLEITTHWERLGLPVPYTD